MLNFNKNSNFGDLRLDFNVPKVECAKKQIVTTKSWKRVPYHYIAYISGTYKKPNTKKKKCVSVTYPIPDHFWAIYMHKMYEQRQSILNFKNRKINLSAHYICYQQAFGSSLGTKLVPYICPKITPLWKATVANANFYRRGYRVSDDIDYNKISRSCFFVGRHSGIFDNYLTIKLVTNPDEYGVFDSRDLL